MAIFRIRPGLRKSDPNPNSSRSLAVRCGVRWRGRCKTSSCCLSRRCSAITARTPPGPDSVAVMKRIGNSRRTASIGIDDARPNRRGGESHAARFGGEHPAIESCDGVAGESAIKAG